LYHTSWYRRDAVDRRGITIITIVCAGEVEAV
jgi:hypothetical protein